MAKVEIPPFDGSFLDGLWDVAFVANTQEEAEAQAWRQIEPLIGKVVWVDRLSGQVDTREWDLDEDAAGWGEWFPIEPVPVIVLGSLANDGLDFDGEVAYPEWEVAPADPDSVVVIPAWTAVDGTEHPEVVVPIEAIEFLSTTAPGVGVLHGFDPDGQVIVYPTDK